MSDAKVEKSDDKAKPILLVIIVLAIVLVYVAYSTGKKKGADSTQQQTEVKAESSAGIVAQPGSANLKTTEMVLVPAGKFIMGTNEVDASGKSQEFGFNEPLYLNEQPQREIELAAFYIDKYEVTNAQFVEYIRALGKYSERDIVNVIERLADRSGVGEGGPWYRWT